MRSNSMTLRLILALMFCGLLLAVACIVDCGPAAARGFGGGFGHMGGGYGRMGGGRGFGGMRGGGSQHQMTRSTGRTNQSSGRTGRNTSTNRNVNNSGSNKTGNYSGAKTTNTQGNVNTSTLNASGASTSAKTTNTSGTLGNSTANTTGANTGSRTGRSPGTPGNSTSTTPVATTGSGTANEPGTVANRGSNTSDTPRGGGRVPGSQTPNLPLTPVGLGGGTGGNPTPAGAGGTGGTIAAGGNPGGGGGNNGSGVPPRGEQRFVRNEIVLGFSSRATPQQIDQLARRYGVTRLGSQSFPLIDVTLYRWRINGRRSVADTIGAIENERVVVSAQPNYLFTLQETAAAKTSATASGEAAQYVLGKLQIEQAHQVATGRNIPIAVINSEIDANHPDLAGAIAKSFDALGGDETPQSHGTAMAGAIAAHGKLSGIALGPHLLAARAFDNTAGGAKATSFAIYKSLQWAADNGARIINMSFAGPPDPNLHRMLTAAYDKGIVLVAAAGNAGPKSAPLYPAADPDVIAVTATDSNDGLFNMANRGSYIAVAAPGVDILALAPGDSYQVTTGTSVAAAHVSGIAAMLLQEKPSLKPAEVRSIIMSTAKPLGSAGQQSDFGAGLADAYRAVTLLNGKEGGEQAKE